MEMKTIKKLMFTVAAAILAVVIFFCFARERAFCMGVPIISQTESERFTQFEEQDLNNRILHMDVPVAIDNASRTIYIAQNIDKETYYTELDGVLTETEGKKMYFVRDGGFENFVQAVAEGHRFRLIIDLQQGTYMEYGVVFTDLPVIRIAGLKTGVDEEDRSIYSGEIIVWDPLYESSGKYSVQTSLLDWHRRGSSTLGDAKKSWKLSLKKEDGTNNDLEFIGLEKGDDDWILNAIYRDDTKIREKMAMDLWNTYLAQEEYNYKMSQGKYAEVVCNGQYCGLYLLQRRIDRKYLELGENQFLAKGIKAADGLPLEEYFDIIGSETAPDKVWDVLENINKRENGRYINLDNWKDVSLLIDFGYMPDNAGKKNVYFVVSESDGEFEAREILWDTDFSFGVNYASGFVHRPEKTVNARRYRHDAVAADHPDLDRMMAERWFEMRSEFLTAENVFRIIDQNYEKINACGAKTRDEQQWGRYYDDSDDSIDVMKKFIEERLEFLDAEHSKNITQQ